jgi:hypothetical protein
LMNASTLAAAASSFAVASSMMTPDTVASYQFSADIALANNTGGAGNVSASLGLGLGWAMSLQCQGAVLLRFGGGVGKLCLCCLCSCFVFPTPCFFVRYFV